MLPPEAQELLPSARVLSVACSLLLVVTAFMPGPAQAPSNPVGTVVVRVSISNFWSELLGGDWIIDGQMDALNQTCISNSRTGHSRYVAPLGLEFALRFNGTAQAADCVSATYTIRLVAQDHVDDSLLDLNGTHAGGPGTICPTNPAPAREQATYCTGTISFTLTGGPVTGSFNGTGDGNLGEQNAAFDYAVQVVSSDIPEVSEPAWSAWLVQLHVDNMSLLFLPDPQSGDWLMDAEAANSTGGCAAESRTMHSRFFTPTQLDILIRDGSSCTNQSLRLRFVAYQHANDGPLDLNGTGNQTCPTGPADAERARPCELAFDFTLAEGVSEQRFANGSLDGNLLESDANLTYRVAAWFQPARATAHIALTLTPPQAVDDWLLDGEARGNSTCVTQARTSHSRFLEPKMLDLDFRGPGAVACLQNPVNITLIAYAHASDSLMDIQNDTHGPACPTHPTPTRAEAAGCLLRIQWPDPSIENAGSSNGADDNHLGELDAQITWTIRRY